MVRLLLAALLLAAAAFPAAAEIRVEAAIAPAEPHVQQQAVWVVRLWRSSALLHGYLVLPEVPDALVEPLDRLEGTAERDGRTWRFEERRLAVFPQRSGRLVLPAPAFSGRDVFVRGPEIVLEVRPAAGDGPWWLPAADLRVTEAWSAGPAMVGRPLERLVEVAATGLTGAQLPPLPLPASPEAEVQRLDARSGTRVVDGAVIGWRSERHLFVPLRAGTLALPELRLDWWDVAAAAPRTAALAPVVLAVAPAPPPATAETAPVPPTITAEPQGAWPFARAVLMATGLAAALALVSIGLRRIRAPERRLHRRIAAAARRGDARATRAALLALAESPGLAALAARLDDQGAAEELRRLDAAVFAAAAQPWDGAAFAACVLPAVRRAGRSRPAAPSPLPGLVP